ncbi:MAG: DEAD/DEAH box helicase family protein [Gammaproteobacteria bacterium]
MSELQSRILLHRFICAEFHGVRDVLNRSDTGMHLLLDPLRFTSPTINPSGSSEYAHALYGNQGQAKFNREQILEYDANIIAHSRRLRMGEEHGRTWKPHQYLALLFTEHYLRRYFDDPEKLLHDLDFFRETHQLNTVQQLPKCAPDDLRTIAFQSATGSGKTLLMHAHILQYRHYLHRAGGRLNNIVLLTPNEQMSAQHEREMRESGLHARVFSKDAGSDVFAPVEILDLNKLAKTTGVKRVAVGDFGDDNLVLVDEGHLGATGKIWRALRKQLASGGFAFEYSATFNQVAGKDAELMTAYAKCMLFDYSYREFHGHGYGKDYAILNLPGGMQDDNSDMYLLGCLLAFYQQCHLWRAHGADWAEFNLTKPLWVFLGRTVTGTGADARERKTDIGRILKFFGWVLANDDLVRPMLKRLLDGKSGLTDADDNDYFAGRFRWLQEIRKKTDIYADLCGLLFHGHGRLHVIYLTAGEGELHLRCGDAQVFGVVNVGDAGGLHKMLVTEKTEGKIPDIEIERETGYAERLFAKVDEPDSGVNVVIGARRFIAGWNSWRVSTMGLMHIGVNEGPQIVQMFGRGVRLKGRDMSLKRHRESGGAMPDDSAQLLELERLHIFGLRAQYMQTFREFLAKEGIHAEQEFFTLPVTWNFARTTDLKIIRLPQERKNEFFDDHLVLRKPSKRAVVTRDLYSQLQSVESANAGGGGALVKQTAKLTHTAFFDKIRVYDKVLLRKQRKKWHNMVIEAETVASLLAADDWYTLTAPPERLRPATFAQVCEQEDLAVELIVEYADYHWRKARRRWEQKNIEVETLSADDSNNIREYRVAMDSTNPLLVRDLRELMGNIREDWLANLKLGVIMRDAHAYKPLLYTERGGKVTVQPVPLDRKEARVVKELADLAKSKDSCLQERQAFLIRNLSRGRGVSFFDDYAYYPDFIIWLKNDESQHVLFLDPKGLSRIGGKERNKIKLHRKIKKTEQQVQKTDPDLFLHAYILSVTPIAEVDGGKRTLDGWKKRGVYFIDEPDFMRDIIRHALRGHAAQK